ncbi:glycosyl hydrolase family 18 protein [Candidatus Contubernalis alkaliaceticus]|uniref:glycosyl hydrolase family 18 protein n=1 Tax=Candidatus Contubernalis alkaliaceticus TaxID=338645 RepID=UPI001F4C064A|nr:glycosyl hydrolase family 18 protein [Candidatus Contubernalis alkalaceticus]UNC93438.1 glycosyl hydrolase [Candidatus Contubernalis alkalaceticus]
MHNPHQRTQKPNFFTGFILPLILLGLVGLSLSTAAFFYLLSEHNPLHAPRVHSLVIDGQVVAAGKNLIRKGEEVAVPLHIFQEYLDPSAVWHPGEETLIVTTAHKTVYLEKDRLSAQVNSLPVNLRFPVTVEGGQTFVPLSFLAGFYEVQLQVFPEEDRVLLKRLNQPYLTGRVTAVRGILRRGPSLNDSALKGLDENTPLVIFGEEQGFYKVQGPQGELGYIHKGSAALGEIEILEGEKGESFVPWRPTGGKINLTWEHIISRNPNTEQIPEMPGLNVISPTWFHLRDEEGNITNLASIDYVDWAQEQGCQVWALFSNNFDKDLTRSVLGSPQKRQYMINQLLIYADLYRLNGINLDFENMYLEDRENFVQFTRELAPLLHEQDMTLSVDVTFISSSKHWSQIYDRKALAQTADYIMVMAYDEHWGSSPVAGSVSSLPWVEKNLLAVLEEVPPEKLILGVPFYTRLWKEEPGEGGEVKVSSRALSMGGIEDLLKQQGAEPVWDEQAGQFYAEYTTEEGRFRTWLEEETSMASRIHLVRKYDLAGAASWRRGFERPEIWHFIEQVLTQRPYEK